MQYLEIKKLVKIKLVLFFQEVVEKCFKEMTINKIFLNEIKKFNTQIKFN